MLDTRFLRSDVFLMLPSLLVVQVVGACAPAPRQLRLRTDDDQARTTALRSPSTPVIGDVQVPVEDRQAMETGSGRRSNGVILAAGGARPPPRSPSVPPRPPTRSNQPVRENEPRPPGYVPGRRLAGPPDAPYWEPVLEIPWRGGRSQGPQPKQPQRASGAATDPSPSIPRQSQQQAGQPATGQAPRTSRQSPPASVGTAGLAGRFGTTAERIAILERVLTPQGGLRTSRVVERQLATERGHIPVRSILDTIASGTRAPDPQGIAEHFMYRSVASFNGSRGTLEVLVHEPSGQIRHVLFRSGGAP